MSVSSLTCNATAVERVAEHLSTKIASGEIKAGERLPPSSALARQFNTSTATVSAAIRSLSEKCQIEYAPGKGVFLSGKSAEKKAFTIGIIGSYAGRIAHHEQAGGQFSSSGLLLESIMHFAGEQEFIVMGLPGTAGEPLGIDKIASYGVNCLVSYGFQISRQSVMELKRRNIPLLLGNRGDGSLPATGASYVDHDTAGMFREAVRIFHGKGHQRIACLFAQSSDDAWSSWRDAFFLEACALDLHYPYKDYVRMLTRSNWSNPSDMMEFFRKQTIELLELPYPPTAIFYHTYTAVLQPALEAIASKGLTPDKGVDVLGLADEGYETNSPISVFVLSEELRGQKVVETAQQLAAAPHEVFHVDIPFRFFQKGEK